MPSREEHWNIIDTETFNLYQNVMINLVGEAYGKGYIYMWEYQYKFMMCFSFLALYSEKSEK